MTSAQPLYAANLREKIQDRYKRSDPPDDGGKLLSVVRSKNRVKESRKKLKAEKQEITTEINPDDNTDTIKSTSLIEEKLNSTPLVEENQPNMVTAAELPEMKLMDISQEEHGKILGNSDISGTPHKDFPVLTRSQQDNLYFPRMMSWEDDSMSESSYVGMDVSNTYQISNYHLMMLVTLSARH